MSRILREPVRIEVFNHRTVELFVRLFGCDAAGCWNVSNGRLSLATTGFGDALDRFDVEAIYGKHMRMDPDAIRSSGLLVSHISDIYRQFPAITGLYEEFWAQVGCDFQINARFYEGDVFAGSASCIQRIHSSDFNALDVDAMHAIHPHLQAGYLACAAVSRDVWFGSALAGVVEAYPDPLFIVEAGQERPVYANREARRWMQSADREGTARIPLIAGSRVAQRVLAALAQGAPDPGEEVEVIPLPAWPRLGLEHPRLVVLRPRHPGTSPLSGRQREVLAAVAGRLRAEDAADSLGVTVSTLRTHLKRIYRKLGVSGLSEALVMARLGTPDGREHPARSRSRS